MLKRACFALCVVFALCACILSGCSDSSSSDKDEDSSWNGNSNGTNSGNGGNSSSGTDSNKIILHAYEFTNVYVWNSENEDLNRQHFPLASEGNGWYKITLDAKSTELLFSNPYEDDQFYDQTLNFEQEAGEWWFLKNEQCNDTESGFGGIKWNGMWYHYKPSVDGSSSGGNEGGGTGNGNNGNEGGSGNVSSGPWTSDIYLEIMMFSNEPTDFNEGVLVKFDSDSAEEFKRQLKSKYQMIEDSATALNLSFHTALANLSDEEKNANLYSLPKFPAERSLKSVNIITFTDGLDYSSNYLSSVYKVEGKNFNDDDDADAYGKWLKEEIATRTISGQKLDCYSIGVLGENASFSDFKEKLQYITSDNEKMHTPMSFDGVAEAFSTIADGLSVVNNKYDFILVVPADAKSVRMVFDGVTDYKYSNLYFDGAISHVGSEYTINITKQRGIDLGATTMKGEHQYTSEGKDTGRFIYRWSDIHFDNYTDSAEILDLLSNEDKCKQFLMRGNEDNLKETNEYDTANNHSSKVDRFSTAIYLILDASKSLRTDIDKVRDAAIQFIDALSEKAKSAASVQ